ncbi:MAG: TerC family protein [Flavobacteriales bacterium]
MSYALFDSANWQAVFTIDGLVVLLTLGLLEIILGVDNIIFISIICGRLPKEQQAKGRILGLGLALLFRIGLLSIIAWIAGLTGELFRIVDFAVSGRDLILFAGGVFLLVKTSLEILHKINGRDELKPGETPKFISFSSAILQIILIDLVFSFDSILTAVGLSKNLVIMVLAVVFAMVVMMIFSGVVSNFINKHPTVKMLALAFLLVIGAVLVLESLHLHVEKAYIYSAMGFSLMVELLNMQMHKQKAIRDGQHKIQ